MNEPTSPNDLQPECLRTGVNLHEAFRAIVNVNLPPGHRRVGSGESVNVQIDVGLCYKILRGLPSQAGTQRFVEAYMKRGSSR